MTANNAQTNTFLEGMDFDTDVNLLPDSKYRYAENVRIVTNDRGTTGALQTIEGVKKYSAFVSKFETIIGTTVVDKYAIIFTKSTSGVTNKVYRVEGFDTANPTTVCIAQGELGLCQDLEKTPNLSVVANYETDTNIKVYFTDGVVSTKILNVVDDKYVHTGNNPLLDRSGNILNVVALDITPGAVLPPLRIESLTNGNLPSGVIQYCYQLFNLHGSETTTSSLSALIHLTVSSTAQDMNSYMGTPPNSSSGKACILQTELLTHDYDKCRIISITYHTNNSIPVIKIVNEFDILPTQSYITYTDNGNAALGEITVEEFNSLTSYQFIGKSLAKQDNRLFVSDITEDTWNPYYDARAYRSTAAGMVRLDSANGTSLIFDNIDTADFTQVPEEHDCINPYNSAKSSSVNTSNDYEYGTHKINDVRLKGGKGPNISYHFVYTNLQLSSPNTNVSSGLIYPGINDNVTPVSLGTLPIYNEKRQNITTEQLPRGLKQPNYADPYISSKYKSYQRDETYRFGIVFYNNKNVPSPVKWIADIRMPHASDPDFAPFDFTSSKISSVSGNVLNAYPLGIRFYVSNIPAGARAFEIVRCDRTEADRTIVTQSAASIACLYRRTAIGDRGSSGGQPSDLRPTSFLTWADNIKTSQLRTGNVRRLHSIDIETIKNDYCILVSPEACLFGDDLANSINEGCYLDTIAGYMSALDGTQTYNEHSNTVGYKAFAVPEKVTSVNSNGTTEQVTMTDGYIPGYIAPDVDGDTAIVMQGERPGGEYTYVPMIAKYFIPFYVNKYFSTNQTIGKQTAGISRVESSINIPYNPTYLNKDGSIFDLTPYYKQVGEGAFLNWSISKALNDVNQGYWEDNLAGASTFGPHGPCLIAYIPGIRQTIKPFEVLSHYRNYNGNYIEDKSSRDINTKTSILVANIKKDTVQYGGNTYSSRSNSVYISTNSYVLCDAANYTMNVFGGDTFLGILDYPVQMVFQGNAVSDRAANKMFIGAYIPLESSVNLNLLHGDMAHQSTSAGNLPGFYQIEPVQMGTYWVQDRPYYAYNGVYSSQAGSKNYVPKSIYTEDNVRMSNRIISSQAKTTNEVFDNWTSFKVADYLDVDNQYGAITNMYSFNDRLFFFQDSALGVASVNDRALIQDNNLGSLTLGTGGVLSRYDYLTTSNGSSITNDRSITNSDSTLYWYDYDKNEICSYSDRISQLSKEKMVQSYLNEMYTRKRDCTLAFYDKKYNEVWFKFQSKSLVFNEQVGQFTSLYTFTPEWSLKFSDKIIALKDNDYYVINSIDTDDLVNVSKKAKLTTVINNDSLRTKVFDNVLFSGDMLNNLNANDPQILMSVLFKTKDQESELFDNTNNRLDYREDVYRFAIPREKRIVAGSDDVTNLSYRGRMRGKYLICDYTFNNNDGSVFKIPYITTTYRHSML